MLRGSKRDNQPALHLVALVAHECASVLAQREALGGDEVAALLILLTEVRLKGRTVSMDAGLLNAAMTQTIVKEQGDYLGSVKGNQAELQALLDEWIEDLQKGTLFGTLLDKQKDTLSWLLRGLAWVRPWITPLTHRGPIGLAAGYLGTIGYIVYIAGDYTDWYRVDPLVVLVLRLLNQHAFKETVQTIA